MINPRVLPSAPRLISSNDTGLPVRLVIISNPVAAMLVCFIFIWPSNIPLAVKVFRLSSTLICSLANDDYPNPLEKAFRLHQSGRAKEAINLYVKLLPQQKNNFQLLYLRGGANLQNRQHERAIVHLQRSLVINPKNPLARNSIGIAFKKLNRLEQALASFDKAIALKPDFADAFNNRSNARCQTFSTWVIETYHA